MKQNSFCKLFISLIIIFSGICFLSFQTKPDINKIIVYKNFKHSGPAGFIDFNLHHWSDTLDAVASLKVVNIRMLNRLLNSKVDKWVVRGKEANISIAGYYQRENSHNKYYFYCEGQELFYSSETRIYYFIPKL